MHLLLKFDSFDMYLVVYLCRIIQIYGRVRPDPDRESGMGEPGERIRHGACLAWSVLHLFSSQYSLLDRLVGSSQSHQSITSTSSTQKT